MGKSKVIHIVPIKGRKDWGFKRQGSQIMSKTFSN